MSGQFTLIKSIAADLKNENLIFKSENTDTDIDIIVRKSDFKKLDFGSKFILLSDRRQCDRHVFYLYPSESRCHIIDFNIDGLSKPGHFRIPFDVILNHTEKVEGIKFINEGFYNKYQMIKKKPGFNANLLLDYMRYNLFRYQKLNLNKIHIALVGLDGSGKTAVSENLAGKIKHGIFVQYMGWTRFKNPIVQFYRRIKYRSGKSAADNNQHSVSNQISKVSILQAMVYYFELYTRYLLVFMRKNCCIIVYDRYFYDWLIRINNKFLKSVFKCITPTPDLIIFLTAPADILYSRKKEVSLHNLKILSSLYYDFLNGFDRVVTINTSRNDEENTVRRILAEIGKIKR